MLSRRTLVCAALVSGCAKAPTLPPTVTKSASVAARGGPFTVRVMSWNVMTQGLGPDWYDPSMPAQDHLWATRAPRVREWLQYADADVIGFQEALGVLDAEGRASNLLAALLPDRSWANIEHFLPIAFRTSLFDLDDSGVVEVFAGNNVSPWQRYCTWARLVHRPTGVRLLVYNTHLQPFQTLPVAKLRSATVDRLIDTMHRLNPKYRLPAVITGDFNARSDETRAVFVDHLRKLAADGWRNSADIAGTDTSEVPGASTHNGFGARAVGAWHYRLISTGGKNYDFVWVRRGTPVLERQTVTGPGVRRLRLADGHRYAFFADGPVPSDHCPVMARVRIG